MRIKAIKIKNFKGISKMEIVLNGKNAEVRGRNGSGKTSIADAINWCLFGKSSDESADFGIRPVGCDKEADSEVTLVLTDDTKIVRKLHEKWTRTKGSEEVRFDGNSTICEWNDVPVKINEFKAKVAGLFPVGDDVFKLCTRSEAFFNLSWQAQKEVLMSISGSVDESEIGMDDFLKEMNGKTLEEFKAGIASRKKEVKTLIETIPARIDEASKVKKVPTEAEKTAYKEVCEQLEALRSTKGNLEAFKAKASGIRNKMQELRKAKDANIQQADAENAKNQSEKKKLERELAECESRIKNIECDIENVKLAIDTKRNQYISEFNKEFSNDGICPVCKQPYTEEKMNEMREAFNEVKAKMLKSISEEGNTLKENLKLDESLLEKMKKERDEKKAQIDHLKQQPDFVADCSAEDKEMAELMEQEKQLLTEYSSTDAERIGELEREKARLELQVVVDDFNAGIEKRICELREQQKKVGDELAKLEASELRAKEYAKLLVEKQEDKINAHFKTIQFKFSKPTLKDGGYIETCYAVNSEGVEFKDMNTASKVNAGLEVINVLSKHYGIEAPIIIDNRERVTDIIECGQQVISLIVDKDCNSIQVNTL